MPHTKTYSNLSARDKTLQIASWLHDKKAANIVALDVAAINPVCEAMIVASAANVRQAKALAEHVLERCAEAGFSYLGMEGQRLGQWVLIDLNDVMVHIFQDELRPFYNLEGLWSEGTPIPLNLSLPETKPE